MIEISSRGKMVLAVAVVLCLLMASTLFLAYRQNSSLLVQRISSLTSSRTKGGMAGKTFEVTRQMNGYRSPDGEYDGYTAVGKIFTVLEEKNGWLKIKIVMPDGGDYGWEGWVKNDGRFFRSAVESN